MSAATATMAAVILSRRDMVGRLSLHHVGGALSCDKPTLVWSR
jgi:hypothetical protein